MRKGLIVAVRITFREYVKIKHNIDETDEKIIEILTQNARTKNTAIARQLDITEGAVRKRIKRLVENNIIQNFTVRLSSRLSGIRAIVQVEIGGNVPPSKIKDIILEEIPEGIVEIMEVTGDVDFFIILHMKKETDLKDAIETIRNIEGVYKTHTHVVLTRHIQPITL